MTRRRALTLATLTLLMTAACRKKSRHVAPPPHVPQPPPPSDRPKIGWIETGIASWYGVPYHGRKAANGETYDMNELTAAHRTLPFGSIVRVTNLSNGESVVLRITDRGPFIEGRIIDLSREGAKRIHLFVAGVAKVRVEVVAYGPARLSAPHATQPESAATRRVEAPVQPGFSEPSTQPASFAVQSGLFNDKAKAEALRARLLREYRPVDLVPREGERTQWRVLVGDKPTEEQAEALASELRRKAGEALVVRRDRP